MTLSGNNHLAMAKTTGLGVSEFATTFIISQILLLLGRRMKFYQLPVTSMNIILAHIEGGDISGNIDESVRHAVTKLPTFILPNEESPAVFFKW